MLSKKQVHISLTNQMTALSQTKGGLVTDHHLLKPKKLHTYSGQKFHRKAGTNISTFGKLVYHNVRIQQHQLYPPRNYRKHYVSHHMHRTYTKTQLSRSFHYLSRTNMEFFIALALALAFDHPHLGLLPRLPKSPLAIANFVAILESLLSTLFVRNLNNFTLASSQSFCRHQRLVKLARSQELLKIACVKYLHATLTYKNKASYSSLDLNKHTSHKWLDYGQAVPMIR